MANKYANLVGTNKIKDEYSKINTGFDKVEADINDVNNRITTLDNRVDTIITTPIDDEAAAQEIVDARAGFSTIGGRMTKIEEDINTKVSKSGDTMSGGLNVPFITFLNSTSSSMIGLAEIQHAGVGRWRFVIELNANLNLWDYDENGESPRATIIIDKRTGQLYNLGNTMWHAGIAGPFYKGAGSPEGVVTAPVGAIYQRTDGGASSTLYVKESGFGNTGWRAV